MHDNSDMDDKPTKRGGGTAVMVLVLVAVLIVLPMLYMLSVGPAVWMATSGRMNPKTLNAIYSPVEWTAKRIPGGGDALLWYVRWWQSSESD